MTDWVRTVYGLVLCAVAGFSGAGAAVFGKLAGTTPIDQTTQIICYVLLLVCNALMLILFTRSMRYNSSLACTACTMVVNISATGLLGRTLFGESTSLQWWVGASSILVGSIFINRNSKALEAPVAQEDGQQQAGGAAAAAGKQGEEQAARGAAKRRMRRA